MTGPADLHVAVIDSMHLVVGDATLCGIDVDLEMDGYADSFALAAWNDPVIPRCVGCETGLLAGGRAAQRAAA